MVGRGLGHVAIAATLLSLLAAAAPAAGQDPVTPGTIAVAVDVAETAVEIQTGDGVIIPVVVRDHSTDSVGGVTQQGGQGLGISHRISWNVLYLTDPIGWSIAPPSPLRMYGGEERHTQVGIQLTPQAKTESLDFVLQAKVIPGFGRDPVFVNTTMRAYSPGLLTFSASVPAVPQLSPREIADVPLEMRNLGVFYRFYTIDVTQNSCGMSVAAPARVFLDAKQDETFTVTLEGPDDRVWYISQACIVTLTISIEDRQGFEQQVFIVSQINGPSIFFEHYAAALLLLLLLLLILLFVKRRKERVEEEILGKPQKPWTLPAEALYLERLEEKDPRAAYVVRHYLMEDEYRSSLLWYYAYKRATKGSRAKERLIVKHERAHERWQDRWAKKVMRPEARADAYEDKLQRKLDRRARKQHKKHLKSWEKEGQALETAHAKAVQKAEERWSKEARKAEKKGLSKPPRPDIAEPEFADAPELQPLPLADHRWQKRGDKYRGKMERREARLKARFERLNERRLRRVRRKVRRIGRKLDDESFIDEHPLLRADA